MKIVSVLQGLSVILIFSLVSKTYTSEVDTKGLINELQSLVGTMDSAGEIYNGLISLANAREEYDQKNYQAFTNARNNEIMPQLHELIEKIKNAQQQKTPITKKMVIGWNRVYKKIIAKYDKLLGTYFGKKDTLKRKEFNEKESGLNNSMNAVLDSREGIKNNILALFKSAKEAEGTESKEEAAEKESKAGKEESAEEEYSVGTLFE